MSAAWKSKGCEVCRSLWESGRTPPEIAVNLDLHSRLHQCASCGTLWEQLERYADAITAAEARKLYPETFPTSDSQ